MSVCKIPGHLHTRSMYMAKKSLFTQFISHFLNKMSQTGITNHLEKQFIPSKPNCEPLKPKGQPLSLEKFASLFVFYFIGCILSLIVLMIENIVKHSRHQYTSKIHENLEIYQTIEAIKNELENGADNKAILTEVKKLILENRRIS